MTDLSATITPKSDQLNADDLITGPRTITITGVRIAKDEQPVAISYEGDGGKPYKPGLSMRRVLVMLWGADQTTYVGRQLTLKRDPEVMFGKDKVGGIRISHMSHIDRDRSLPLTTTRGQRRPYEVKKLIAPEPPRVSDDEPRSTAPSPELKARAHAAAEQGTTTFRGFWETTLTKQERTQLAGDLAALKGTAHEADTRGAPTDPDPFTPPEGERMPGED
jgi:hypothetical protein